MAAKDGLLVGHVFVTSLCRRVSASGHVKDLSRGSADTEHVVEVENGSMLPYDISVLSVLPDSPPKKPTGSPTAEFTQGSQPRTLEWTASVDQLAGGDTHPEAAKLHCIATAPANLRILSPTILYRTGPGVAWESDPTVTKTLSITLTVL